MIIAGANYLPDGYFIVASTILDKNNLNILSNAIDLSFGVPHFCSNQKCIASGGHTHETIPYARQIQRIDGARAYPISNEILSILNTLKINNPSTIGTLPDPIALDSSWIGSIKL